MAITIHPRPGQILVCDFSRGFKEPEMVKSERPVIVLTGAIKGRLGPEQMKQIYQSILHGLNLSKLATHV